MNAQNLLPARFEINDMQLLNFRNFKIEKSVDIVELLTFIMNSVYILGTFVQVHPHIIKLKYNNTLVFTRHKHQPLKSCKNNY